MVSLDGTEMRGRKDETEMMRESAIEQTELFATNPTPDTSLNIYAIGTLVQVIAGTHKGKRLEPCWISLITKFKYCCQCNAITTAISCTALRHRDVDFATS